MANRQHHQGEDQSLIMAPEAVLELCLQQQVGLEVHLEQHLLDPLENLTIQPPKWPQLSQLQTLSDQRLHTNWKKRAELPGRETQFSQKMVQHLSMIHPFQEGLAKMTLASLKVHLEDQV